MKNSLWYNQSVGTLTVLYLEKTGQIQKEKKRKLVWSLTRAEVPATWAYSVWVNSTGRLVQQSIYRYDS